MLSGSLPRFTRVVWSAHQAGSCSWVAWRSDDAGRVAIPMFRDAARAQAFAARWSRHLGVPLRPEPCVVPRQFAVRVPVQPWESLSHGFLVLRRCGGPLGIRAQLVAVAAQPW